MIIRWKIIIRSLACDSTEPREEIVGTCHHLAAAAKLVEEYSRQCRLENISEIRFVPQKEE